MANHVKIEDVKNTNSDGITKVVNNRLWTSVENTVDTSVTNTLATVIYNSSNDELSINTAGEIKEENSDNILVNQTNGNQKTLIVNTAGDIANLTQNTGSSVDLHNEYGINSNSILYGRASGTLIRPITTDLSTHALNLITYNHHEIHSGNAFYIQNWEQLANGGSTNFLFRTPDTTKWSHFDFEFENQVEAEYTILEAVTVTDVGTTITPINRNRNSSNTATLLSYQDATYTGGTQIAAGRFGSGRVFGGKLRDAEERMLKQNTDYIFLIENVTAGATNNINWFFDWYEHTDKN